MKVKKSGTPWTTDLPCKGGLCGENSPNGDGGGCGATVMVSANDLFMARQFDQDGTTDYFPAMRCPDCGVITAFDPIFVPNSVLDRIIGTEF